MTEPNPEEISASRRKLLIIVAIAFVPIFIAYALYFYFPALAPDRSTNQGQLISPPVEAVDINPDLLSAGRWELIVPVGAHCDDACREMLYLSRQVVAGLGKDSDRVHRTLLLASGVPGELEPLLAEEHADIRRIKGPLEPLLTLDESRPLIFLMDPNGNIMMYFRLDQAGKPMLKDLKHLLKLSNIG